jgi:hypothetical protein
MNKLLFLFLVLNPLIIFSKQDMPYSVQSQVATQMVEEGKVDESRYFIFYFSYSEDYCNVDSITINNANCSKISLGGKKGFWLKPEHSSKDFSGDSFTCKLTKISANKIQLLIEDPVELNAKLTHRIIFKDNKQIILRDIEDYSGVMSKYSTITNKNEVVTYKPITGKFDGSNYGWNSLDMGCKSMTIPIITK